MTEHEVTEVFQAKYIPQQTPPKPEHLSHGSMKATITSYPPLGQVTIVPPGKQHFTISIELDESRASAPWQVALYYTTKSRKWEEKILEKSQNSSGNLPYFLLQDVQKEGFSPSRIYFYGTLDLDANVVFTVKFRADANQDWRWVKDGQGVEDGNLIVKSSAIAVPIYDDLANLIGDLNPAFKSEKVRSQTPNTSVWSIGAPIVAAIGDDSAFADVSFGNPWHGEYLK